MQWRTDRRTGLLTPEHDLAGKLYSPQNQLLGVTTPAVVGGVTYATWNPADKNAVLSLSGGDLVVTTAGAGSNPGLRATLGKAAGKWYYELTVTVIGSGFGVGHCTSGQNLTGGGAYANLEDTDTLYYTNGSKFKSNSAYGATFTTGDVIGVRLDMDGGTVTYYKNDVSQGQLGPSVAGLTIFPSCYMETAVDGKQCTANFGATAFVYSVPGGYNSGLYV